MGTPLRQRLTLRSQRHGSIANTGEKSAARVADQSLAHLQQRSTIERQTWFAAALDRARLLGNLAERMVTEFSR
tara:strand:- start:12430 stop:12651 length:222 start_codon:yes stop_codon:yes gene_type:complete